jgi:hypothetical protein
MVIGQAVIVLFEFFLLAALWIGFFNDLRPHCTKNLARAVLFTGVSAGIALRSIYLLVANQATLGNLWRNFDGMASADIFLAATNFVASDLFGCGVAGLFATWLVGRTWVRGIRPDKTTMFIAGAVGGLGVGLLSELVRVHWRIASGVQPPRLFLCALIGGLFSVIFLRKLLFRDGRFQFSIKSLLVLTLVWAVVLGLLSPQWNRYDQEERAVREIEAILGQPVECRRMAGFVGLEYVSAVKFPTARIPDEKVAPLVTQLRRFPQLDYIEVSGTTFSPEATRHIQEAWPSIRPGRPAIFLVR